MNRTQALEQKILDEDQWQKLYYRHQQQYIRRRLDAIKLLKQGRCRLSSCFRGKGNCFKPQVVHK